MPDQQAAVKAARVAAAKGGAGQPMQLPPVAANPQAPSAMALPITPDPSTLGVLANASPAMPASQGDLIAQEILERSARAHAIEQQLGGLQQREAASGIPSWRANDPNLNLSPEMRTEVSQYGIPRTSITQEPWMKMEPVTGHGVLGGLFSALKDIGRGALAGVAATAPGRAVQEAHYGVPHATTRRKRRLPRNRFRTCRSKAGLRKRHWGR